jgi:hypothetical protein
MMYEVWYRFEDVHYAAPEDEFGTWSGPGRTDVVLREWPVFSYTRKGVWLGWGSRERFVLRDAGKRFACPTIEEAKESFRARKRKQARIYRNRLRDAEDALAMIDDKRKFPDPVMKPTHLWVVFDQGDPITANVGVDADQKNYWGLARQIESSRAAIENRLARRIMTLEVVQADISKNRDI